MKRLISAAIFVAIGFAIGATTTRQAAAQQAAAGLRLNHVGIAVRNFDETMAYYTQKLGFREAYILRDKDGAPTMAAIQISRDTFIEVTPANANRPAGLTHMGLQTDDIQGTVGKLRQAGATLTDPRVATNTNVTLTNATDPDGIRVELFQLNADSLQGKAMQAWK